MKKTTWKDYESGNAETRELESGYVISEAEGKTRLKTQCPFCNTPIEIYMWAGQKRCETCGAICSRFVCFKVKEPELQEENK